VEPKVSKDPKIVLVYSVRGLAYEEDPFIKQVGPPVKVVEEIAI
jgi:hypothetical protein